MILLSAHLDRVRSDFDLRYDKRQLTGLLDNILGVMTIYHILLADRNIEWLEKKGKLKIWHNFSEEWGGLDDTMPKLDKKKDVVIVVDVCGGKRYKDLDFTIENISGLSKPVQKDIAYFLKTEGFAAKVKEYTGDPSEADEAFSFRKLGIPVVSFIIPIDCPDDSWHRIQDDTSIDLRKWRIACEGLKRLICYFHE